MWFTRTVRWDPKPSFYRSCPGETKGAAKNDEIKSQVVLIASGLHSIATKLKLMR